MESEAKFNPAAAARGRRPRPSILVLAVFAGAMSAARADDFDQHRVACDATQEAFAKAAVKEAKTILSKTIASLPPSHSQAGARFQRWFGGKEGDDDPVIKRVFVEVDGLLVFKRYWCPNMSLPGSSPNRLAFVPKNSFSEIFLDNGFFNLTTSGADTRGGTIVHEAAHQATSAKIVDSDVTGDGEADYGVANAELLARQSPKTARRTADNLQYYAEDTSHGIP